MHCRTGPLAVAFTVPFFALSQQASAQEAHYQAMVARHAAANGVPASLVHRVIMRESRYNPRAVSRGNYGMMQIRLGTARAMGYSGGAHGLLDPETNMTYAVRYLAGAYRAAGGSHERAMRYYQSGYYHQAKRQGFSPYASSAARISSRVVPQAARDSYAAVIDGNAAAPARLQHSADAAMPGRYTYELPSNN